jgi:hypothetical protein
VFAVAVGAQYQATDRLVLRSGYLYNTNPIRNEATLFNVQAPGIITNTITLGASYDLTENVTFSLTWMHGFRNSVEGPIIQVPNSSVRLDAQLDTLWAGFNVKFDGSRRKGPAPAASPGVDSVPEIIESAPATTAASGSGDPVGAGTIPDATVDGTALDSVPPAAARPGA